MKLHNFGEEFASEGVEAAYIPQTIFLFIATKKSAFDYYWQL